MDTAPDTVSADSRDATPEADSLGQTSLASNESDDATKAAMQALVDYCQSKTGAAISIDTIDHATYQDQIVSYLEGAPDDVLTWFAGNRLRFFADQGLLSSIDDVWADIGDNYTDAFKVASTGRDGKLYFVPATNYPWVMMYRKSVFAAKGYTVPATIDELKALGDKMIADGLVPMAFGDADGWPAMGTFDILDMRVNGYDFHIGLMEGREHWSDPRARAVFELWRELLPYTEDGATSRTWQDAGNEVFVNKTAGMYFLGTFATYLAPTAEDAADIGFFPFPLAGNAFDSEAAIDAPIDGFMLSAHPKNPAAAKAFLACIATVPAQKIFTAGTGSLATVKGADTSDYAQGQKDAATIIAQAGRIAQFLDRDARPDFAGSAGMQGFLQSFLDDPTQDLTSFVASIQAFWDSLPPLD